MENRREPTLTSTKLMLWQQLYSHEKHLQEIKPQVASYSHSDYSHITSGPASKKCQMRRERENLIESDNMILLDKLYSILSNSTQPKGKKENKSLNYPKRKQEIGRINVENRCLYKSLIDVKPTVDLKKIGKWNESMQRYSRNISSSCRRKDPHRPILTYGILKAYPEMRVKTSIGRSRIRKLSAEVPSFEHFANILNMDLE